MQKKILVTGGAGFIGSHLVRLLVNKYPERIIYNLDKLTYAGNLENLRDIEDKENYRFIKGDITDSDFINELFKEHRFQGVIHLAAESHVDRSIESPNEFVQTNIVGTVNLLNAFRAHKPEDAELFYHVSTDEVYGSLGKTGLFTEETPYDPRSPYSAAKASSDHLVRAYGHTFDLPYIISNCSNNYGANQFPEKLIPLAINNIKNKKPIPIYGKGDNVRDWLFVEDHAAAIDLLYHRGRRQETYNIGGNNEWTNLDLINTLCKIADKKLDRKPGESQELITFVKDRAGHDKRYAIDSSKIQNELGWKPSVTFEEGMELTLDWYLNNEEWLNRVVSGAYAEYYDKMYKGR